MTKQFFIKGFKITLIILAVILAAVQFVRPARTNPPVVAGQSIESHVTVTPEVASILDRSCKDCHSNRTEWPWYSNVAPVSWFVIDHVNHGRSHLNLSEWAKFDDVEAEETLEEICKEVKSGSMPLESYLYLHRHARLSPGDVKILCDWSRSEQERIAARQAVTGSAQ